MVALSIATVQTPSSPTDTPVQLLDSRIDAGEIVVFMGFQSNQAAVVAMLTRLDNRASW